MCDETAVNYIDQPEDSPLLWKENKCEFLLAFCSSVRFTSCLLIFLGTLGFAASLYVHNYKSIPGGLAFFLEMSCLALIFIGAIRCLPNDGHPLEREYQALDSPRHPRSNSISFRSYHRPHQDADVDVVDALLLV